MFLGTAIMTREDGEVDGNDSLLLEKAAAHCALMDFVVVLSHTSLMKETAREKKLQPG
mgnify:CR=1 FL=1